MEDWEANWDRDVLWRIVALLFSLAGLADLAAGAPYRRRLRVLGFVSHGEVEARAFVIGMVCGAPVAAEALEPAVDAAQLAAQLRVLALILCAVLAQRSALPGARGPRAGWPLHALSRPAACRSYGRALPAPDTS